MSRTACAGATSCRYAMLLVSAFATAPALAADFNFTDEKWGEFQFSWNNRVTVGAAVRTQDQDYRIVDKQNVPGQATLCAISPKGQEWYFDPLGNNECKSVQGDPTPSRVLLGARGGYNINGDDGDLNYDKGDITYSGISLRSTLSGAWRNFNFKLGGIGFYDPVNYDFKTHSRDLEYGGRGGQPEDYGTPGGIGGQDKTITLHRSSERHADLERDAGLRADLLEAFVSGVFKVGDERELHVTVGQQYLRWGESTFMIFNTLNQVNPLSAPLYRFPGSEVKDAYLPTNMISASIDLVSKLTLTGFYQLAWAPTEPDVAGTFLSVSDVAGAGHGPTPVYLAVGNSPEDPMNEMISAGIDQQATDGKRTAYLLGEHYGDARDSGQFGFRLDYYADWLNGGTEVSLYGMNIHSRLPYYSANAADKSCISIEGEFGQIIYDSERQGCVSGVISDPQTAARYAASLLPVDTMKPFLEYPEDIHIFGASFNTTVGDWSLAGEVSYSPNQPAQVSTVDVTYAALQPAFPDPAPPGPDGTTYDHVGVPIPGSQYGNVVLWPTNRVYVPDYVETVYRGHKVQPGDYIRGYERLEVGQATLTGIRIFSGSNFLHADQILLVGEVAAIRVFDMPSIDRLQFEAFTGRQTHYSVGWSEYDPVRDAVDPNTGARVISPLDVANPERASRKDFADDFAWGYRARLYVTYEDVFRGIGMTPGVEVWHDVHGTSISPGQDFVEGRILTTLSTEFKFTQSFTALARYVMFDGAGYRNLRIDRDYAELSFTYAF